MELIQKSITFLFAAAIAATSASASDKALTRIAFGSCNKHDRPQLVWEAIVEYSPQLWIWLGDNVYGDTEDIDLLRQKWSAQKNHGAYRALASSAIITGIWDDHDYGVNDGGKDYPMKEQSQQAFLDFLDVPPEDVRRTQQGIYTTQTFGPEGKEIQVILLDLRFHREKPGEESDILGDAQWAWLTKTLSKSTAPLVLIASSSQVLPSEHPFEKWTDYPNARARFLKLLEGNSKQTTILLSGDRHHAEISALDPGPTGKPLVEITASGLTHSRGGQITEANQLRVGNAFGGLNFGTLDIDWDSGVIKAAIRDQRGTVVNEVEVMLPTQPSPAQSPSAAEESAIANPNPAEEAAVSTQNSPIESSSTSEPQ